MVSRSIGLVVVVLTLAQPATAVAQVESLVSTNHTIAIGGKPLRYVAHIGRIPIKDGESGEAHGYMGSPRRGNPS
jgi:hypothetical protein